MLVAFFLLCLLCHANDNNQIVQQKFIVLSDESRIAISDERKKLFSIWDEYFEDHPEFTDIPVKCDTKMYEQLSMLIQSKGTCFPASRDDIQRLYLFAHGNGLHKEYLKYIEDHAVYNFKEFALASDVVQQTLSNEFIKNEDTIAGLLKSEFWGKTLPQKKFHNKYFILSAHYIAFTENRGFIFNAKDFLLIFPIKKVMRLEQTNPTIDDLKKDSIPIEIEWTGHGMKMFEAGKKLFVTAENGLLHVVNLLDSKVESMDLRIGKVTIEQIVCDKKRQKAYVYYNYGYYRSGCDKKNCSGQIREWDLTNFSLETIETAPIIFDRIIDAPIMHMCWDKYFNELQWVYPKEIDATTHLMWSTYKPGQESHMQTIKGQWNRHDLELVGNRLMLIASQRNGNVWIADRLTGGMKHWSSSESIPNRPCFSQNGLFNIQRQYLCYQNIRINDLEDHTFNFVSNRFIGKNNNVIVDLNEIKKAYKKLSGNKFYMQRIPKEEKVDIA